MAAYQGKYRKLYSHLCELTTREWRTSFAEIESIIGFQLPPSARRHRASWANDHSQARPRAWLAAGWNTAEVNMSAETLTFQRNLPPPAHSRTLDEIWPVHSVGVWPQGLSLRREDLYEDRI